MPSAISRKTLRRVAQRSVPFVFYGLLFVFLAAYLRTVDFEKIIHLHVSWLHIVLATLFGLLTRYLGAFIWLTILRTLGAQNVGMHTQLIYVYAKSWMGRYIPGTAPWILGKIYFASKHGVPKQKLAISSLLEAGIEIVTMLVLAFSLLLFDNRLDVLNTQVKGIMLLVAVGGIIALIPAVFNWWVGLAFRLLGRKPLSPEHRTTTKTVTQGTGLYLINSLINGISLFFIAKGIDPSLGYSNILFTIGASSLAGAAGMVAVFAPSGLGVREGIQLVLFSLIMPKELAVAVTVATRLWIIAVDFMFFGISKWVARTQPALPPAD